MKVCFYNHYHHGDLHVSRSFVRLIMDKIKSIHPEAIFAYSHQNDPNLLFDIPDLVFDSEAVHSLPEQESFIRRDDTLYINTWYGMRHRSYLHRNGTTFDTLYSSLNDTCHELFNFSLADISTDPKDFFPAIDYDKFAIGHARNWLFTHPENKVLIENGNANSGQATNFSMAPIIVPLAIKHKDTAFILSKKENIRMNNIFYTDDIIQKGHGSDLNEISFLSRYCSLLIGRASGVFTFGLTQDNLFRGQMKYLCFSNLVPARFGKFWLGPLFQDQINYTATIQAYNESNPFRVQQIIEANL